MVKSLSPKRLMVVVVAALLGLLLLASVAKVSAKANKGDANASSTTVQPPPAGSNFEQRLAFYKKNYGVKLSEEDAKHLESECINAQSKLREIQSDAKTTLQTHNDTYRNIDGVILVNIGRLKLANQTVFDLMQQEATFVRYTADFNTLSVGYLQALDDSLAINCQSDPTGFQALVEADRSFYKALSTQRDIIYNFTTNKIKATLEGYFK